ncbi:MAG: hypothetical protein QXS85_03535 [Acidilobaceae archaeon]
MNSLSEISRLLRVVVENRGIYCDKRGFLTSEGLKVVCLAIKVSGRMGEHRLKRRLEKVRRERRVDILLEVLRELE